ncbi:anthranilate synthase component II [Staphylococcus capitis]|uniref:anthranilate synthase component II n=1 Tax=Staphylococcus capitis TaxID=29388 RepID=UPI00021A3690|nr:aminodeoxychorismate/anthranilate synthase component II [Staphylococcus capitis]EGS39792.1 glutamine amidotransferase, class I [Staphylococcus capitis VCU116]MCT2014443.1 aminodeoxychorismate/anthranilate synthase component II [Staphylococcus capitis]MEB5627916.1 aminodeoxychorismate/anthranilate synthase component II [Staphylococcus capitis]
MIVMIDNHDSFTYNLIDYLKVQTTDEVKVISVNEVSITKLKKLSPKAIIISPGPGKPSDYPVLSTIISHYEQLMPILGVCLGFQLIVEYYGGRIIHSPKPIHGHTTTLRHTNEGIFKGLPQEFNVMRYHSLMVDPEYIPNTLKVTATNDENVIMAVQHQYLSIYGVQYHPESILSEYGHDQLKLFLNEAGVEYAC